MGVWDGGRLPYKDMGLRRGGIGRSFWIVWVEPLLGKGSFDMRGIPDVGCGI